MNVNVLSEILTLNQEFQFEACSNNLECKNLSYIYQIDNEEHIPSFNLQCRLAGDSVRSLFQIAIFDLSVKTVKHEKGPYFKGQSRPYFKQSIPPEFSHSTKASRYSIITAIQISVRKTTFYKNNWRRVSNRLPLFIIKPFHILTIKI